MNNIDIALYKVSKFMNLLGNIQNKIPNIIHIAGTNGKGSTTTILRYLLQCHGYKVNTFTSPHLINYNERLRILGSILSNEAINDIKQEISNIDGYYDLSMFELATVIFFIASYRNQADFTIVETGLGGRLDATNIINKRKLVILTPIGLDHQQFLGTSITDIAFEKASIITPNSIVISAYQHLQVVDVFMKFAQSQNAKFYYGGNDYLFTKHKNQTSVCSFDNQEYLLSKINLLGEHQLQNASLAIYSASKLISLTQNNIDNALNSATWPGRLQKVDALYDVNIKCDCYLDGAHNDIGFDVLKKFILQSMVYSTKVYIIIAMLKNKDLVEFFNIFANIKDNIILYPYEIEDHNCFTQKEIYDLAKKYNIKVHLYNDIKDIIININSSCSSNDISIITGSLYFIGSILKDNNYIIN